MAREQLFEFAPIVLEPFILANGSRHSITGFQSVELEILSSNIEGARIETFGELSEYLEMLTYKAKLVDSDISMDIPYTRFRGHHQVSKYAEQIWEASRTYIVTQRASDNPVRSKYTSDEKKNIRKVSMGPKESAAVKRLAQSIQIIEAREKGGRDRQTTNLRSIRTIAEVVNTQVAKDYVSTSVLKSCSDYLTLMVLTCNPTVLEIHEMKQLQRIIENAVEISAEPEYE